MRRALPLLLLASVLAGPAAAEPGPDGRLPPSAATTPRPNDAVGSTTQVPAVAYPDAPTATPAAEGADRTRPPAEEKAGR